MSTDKLKLVIGGPQGFWDALGPEAKDGLLNAHPNVHAKAVNNVEEFSELALHADGVMTFGFKVPPEVLTQDSRLRWVHSIQAGIDSIATGELIAAEHVTFTSSKGTRRPSTSLRLAFPPAP